MKSNLSSTRIRAIGAARRLQRPVTSNVSNVKAIMKSLFLFLIFGFAGNAFASDLPVKNENQLLGCWKRQIFSEATMKRLSTFDIYDPVLQKYQWFCFFKGGEYRVVTMNRDSELKTSDIRKSTEGQPKVMSWQLMSDGVVRVEHKEDPSQTMPWLMSFTTEPLQTDQGEILAKGTLVMLVISRDKTKYLYRALVKIE